VFQTQFFSRSHNTKRSLICHQTFWCVCCTVNTKAVAKQTCGSVCFCILKALLKKFEIFLFFSLFQINIFLDHFDALILKIIFFKKENIILIYF
jgi:hypothetical protein